MCLYPALHVLLYGHYCMQCFDFVLNIVKIGDLTLLTPLNPGAYLLAASNPCGKYISTASVIFGSLARAPR